MNILCYYLSAIARFLMNVTKDKLQIIGELHDSSARPKPLVSLRRRTLSTGTRRRRNRRRENVGRLVTPLENCSEYHSLCAATVFREEVRILNVFFFYHKFFCILLIIWRIRVGFIRRPKVIYAWLSARISNRWHNQSSCNRSLKIATSAIAVSLKQQVSSVRWVTL